MTPSPELFPLAGRRVFVAGHRGMVGSALVRRLAAEDCETITVERAVVDLRDQRAASAWLESQRPEVMFVAAATVGGIAANDSRPAEFLYDNLMIEANLIHAAYRIKAAKLIFLGSTCIYPKLAAQPMAETALLTGPLEPTNEWYAIAKIAGIKLCQAYRKQYGCDFISAMPTNLYGPGDNFDLESAHVLPALMRKIHAAKQVSAPSVEIWGTGKPTREFLYVEDAADALVYLAKQYSGTEHVNVGSGGEIAIGDLAKRIATTVGFQGGFSFNAGRPDGTPRKLADSSKLAQLGWRAATSLDDGLAATYRWFLEHARDARGMAA